MLENAYNISLLAIVSLSSWKCCLYILDKILIPTPQMEHIGTCPGSKTQEMEAEGSVILGYP